MDEYVPMAPLKGPDGTTSWGYVTSSGIETVGLVLTKDCKDHGIKINVWTVNDMDALEKLYAWDVDGIFSNYPSIPMAWLAAKK